MTARSHSLASNAGEPLITAPASTSPQSTPISEKAALIALAVERYVLPWLYVWFAYRQISTLHHDYGVYQMMLRLGTQQISKAVFCRKFVAISSL